MMAAQLIAAHNAAMECYRRAMIGERTLEGRRENLAQGAADGMMIVSVAATPPCEGSAGADDGGLREGARHGSFAQ